MFCFFSLFSLSLADPMQFINYYNSSEYFWSSLQSSNPYTLDTGPDVLKFSIGAVLEETCNGQSGSVIRFSKSSSACEVLGRQEQAYVNAYTHTEVPALAVFYEGGGLCRSQMLGDIRRRTQFQLVCSPVEDEFRLKSSLEQCTTVIEKKTQAGCPRPIQYSMWVKVIFFG
jgi:hypothetical protein